jgi:D-3-phosphoglycerate dehydrogenase
MKHPKILIADKLASEGLEILKSAAQVDDCAGISPSELLEIIPNYAALVVRSRTIVSPQIIAAASRLKVIGRAGVGVDNLDLGAAQARGIIVINTPAAATAAVAELTIGLMLDLSRGFSRASADVKGGKWNKANFLGHELYGKTLGIIGMGNIGSSVAAYATVMGMTVIAYDPLRSTEAIQQRGALPTSLEDLYSQSDFISLHMPRTQETDNFIDRRALAGMKPGVRVICTARGGLIDENALFDALERGHVGGAALDVFVQEPPGLSPLINHPSVIATPHIGAQTVEAQVRVGIDIAQEMLAALRGDPLRWRVV